MRRNVAVKSENLSELSRLKMLNFAFCYFYLSFFFFRIRKPTQSESADEEATAAVVPETEEAVASELAPVQDAEVKPSESPIQDDQEHVDSSTTEPIVTDTKEDNEAKVEEPSEATEEAEKKEATAETTDKETVEASTPAKKKPSRKRSVGKSSIGRSPRSSK